MDLIPQSSETQAESVSTADWGQALEAVCLSSPANVAPVLSATGLIVAMHRAMHNSVHAAHCSQYYNYLASNDFLYKGLSDVHYLPSE